MTKSFDKSGDLARLTGRTVRIIIHWSDHGILKAEPTGETQGRGDQRGYPNQPLYGERKWALLADTLLLRGMTVKQVAGIINELRERLTPEWANGQDAYYLTGAIQGHLEPVYLVMIDRAHDKPELRIFFDKIDLNDHQESDSSIAMDRMSMGTLMRSIGDADITYINLNRVFKRLHLT